MSWFVVYISVEKNVASGLTIYLGSPNSGREEELNFASQKDAKAWFDNASSLLGTKFMEPFVRLRSSESCHEPAQFFNNGTLTEEEWWKQALSFKPCKETPPKLVSLRSLNFKVCRYTGEK